MASYVIERELEGGSAPGCYFACLVLPVIEPRFHTIVCFATFGQADNLRSQVDHVLRVQSRSCSRG